MLFACFLCIKLFLLLRKFTKIVASISFWLRYQPNRLAVGALPQTPLEELTALPQTSELYLGDLLLREGREGREEGEKEGEEGRPSR